MIIEVGNAGDVLIPAQLVGAMPRTRLSVERDGDALVLRPLTLTAADPGQRLLDSLPVLEGCFADNSSPFRGTDLYE